MESSIPPVRGPRPIRVPQQKRAIEKKLRVVEAALSVFSTKGFNNTTTPDIAHAAGISTGTLYAYFRDKKELFMECFKKYSIDIQASLLDAFHKLPTITLQTILESTIVTLIDLHAGSQAFHRQVMSQIYLDQEVRDCYFEQHERVVNTIISQLVQEKVMAEHGREKVFLAVAQIEAISHEFALNEKSHLDKGIMIELCKQMIMSIA